MAIDIVYLWVDGTDPAWQEKRAHAASRFAATKSEFAPHADVDGRYRDNGELRYNLRALERFFPDHGQIYIVTDGQRPAWLREHPKVTPVDHRDLIPSSKLPVFDSGNIESYIHHIPGLSEQFFYLNDDVFFGAPVDPVFWFGDRVTVAMEARPVPHLEELQKNANALVNASVQSAHWLAQEFDAYVHDPYLCSHSPRPILKRALNQLEAAAPRLFEKVRATTFRSWLAPPIVSDLLPRWMIQVGMAKKVFLDPLYIETGSAQAASDFQFLKSSFGNLPFFCINDTCDNAPADDPTLLRVTDTLEHLLSQPSSFECFAVQ